MASHGTDQLLVQRLLGCKTAGTANAHSCWTRPSLSCSLRFFLVLGLCLFAFYGGVPFQQLGLKSSDEIFPKFIVENLPSGVAGW